jgi:hypothetical protein
VEETGTWECALLCRQSNEPEESASHPGLEQEDTAICAVSMSPPHWTAIPLHIEGGIFQPSDFKSAEAMGPDIPHRCTSCLKCKECKFRTDSLTFKENQEYQVILDGLKFNGAQEKWTATYPFRIPPSTLQDHSEQVYRYTLVQERRLAKQERTQKFNAF